MSVEAVYEWHDGELVVVDDCERSVPVIEAADSFLVSNGCAIAAPLHRARFFASVTLQSRHLDGVENLELDAFWRASLALIPAEGDWFPRLELRSRHQVAELAFRHRSAPPLAESLTLITHKGQDPRRSPGIKGPDIEALLRLRVQAQERGADEPVLLTHDGAVVDGATSAIAWWRGDVFCMPPCGAESADFARVDSITARSLLSLLREHGIEIRREQATVASLEGAEVWALSALHGIRIATHWIDGPTLTRIPGRLELWRKRHHALRRPIEVSTP